MPLSNGKYVSPTWKNGQAPALDAAELQAITDTLVKAQNAGDDNAEAIAALQTAMGGYAKIQVGSYKGTGTTKTLTTPFYPRAVFIASLTTTNYYYFYSAIRPSAQIGTGGGGRGSNISWGSTSVTMDWGVSNMTDNTYQYLILG